MTETAFQSKALARVAAGDLCAGCGGCALVAPGKVEMHVAAPGFLRPRQTAPLTPDEEATVSAICPGLGQRVEASGRADDALWGPYVSMRAGWSTDDEVRYQGSSGGALTAALVHLLKAGRIDGVVQIGADPQLATGNVTVLSDDRAGAVAAAGSRYAPSAPLAGLEAQLSGEGSYAFVGKPCDAVALRALAERDPRVDRRFPWIFSFFCAGVPSLMGSGRVLEALGTDQDGTESFRYRGQGWPGKATALTRDGRRLQMSYHDSWGKILSKHVQHRCKICPDGTGVAADLVCADAWETDDRGYPVFEEEDGISLIVGRTAKGEALISEMIEAGAIEARPFDPAALAAIQPGQRNRRRALAARLAGLRVTGRPVPRYRGLRIGEAARQNDLRTNLVNFLGMVRRSLRARAG